MCYILVPSKINKKRYIKSFLRKYRVKLIVVKYIYMSLLLSFKISWTIWILLVTLLRWRNHVDFSKETATCHNKDKRNFFSLNAFVSMKCHNLSFLIQFFQEVSSFEIKLEFLNLLREVPHVLRCSHKHVLFYMSP